MSEILPRQNKIHKNGEHHQAEASTTSVNVSDRNKNVQARGAATVVFELRSDEVVKLSRDLN
jgi:hypothetical protein